MLSNYRPISLLPTISKIFERILYNQLYDYFNSNNLLAEEQYGFRTNQSTKYAAVKLVDNVSKEIELGNTPTALLLIGQKRLIHYHLSILSIFISVTLW